LGGTPHGVPSPDSADHLRDDFLQILSGQNGGALHRLEAGLRIQSCSNEMSKIIHEVPGAS
jgi:hypothetical protein